MTMDDLGATSEIKNTETFSIYEKSDVVKEVASKVDEALGKMETPFLLIKGGPGVGKSTASYESLDYLRQRGYRTVEMMPEQLGTEKARNRIADMGPNTILFIDSLDAILSDESPTLELSQTVDLLKRLKAEDNCPIVIANIHDPYLVNKGLEGAHSEKRPLFVGPNGLFDNPDYYIQVNDECVDDFSVNVAISKSSKKDGVNATWVPFLQSELKGLQVNTHSIISNIFSDVSLEMAGQSIPSELTNEYSPQAQESIKQWLKERIASVKSSNETYKRAYFEPDHPDEAYKGLVRHDI